ncbi:DUF805 domain-containing protein [Sandaracinobacteroides saxicola]|uniref:DUF805 domain-containing protein n=1 Tax=Sandaracinobacteroides saxicola TaxID=2759707 RepID=A0A7G5IKB8_9SPHN|nr:DUF805 domain-containing protein [Sandaracinobacteroides saxicola]QMW23810.1 DUF805 domain-containing protein [Sandaracinobacteroides saxicola]
MMFEPLRRYADFRGRSRRQEYWLFSLFLVVIYAFVALVGTLVSPPGPNGEPGGVFIALVGILALAFFIPSLAVAVRRLHDTDRSGWWYLIGLVPLIGSIVLLVFFVLDGTPGPNRFGDDPKGRGNPGIMER